MEARKSEESNRLFGNRVLRYEDNTRHLVKLVLQLHTHLVWLPDDTLEPEANKTWYLQAHAADILIFAAAINKGKGHFIAFPACMDEVICVSSTDCVSQASVLNPNTPLCDWGRLRRPLVTSSKFKRGSGIITGK